MEQSIPAAARRNPPGVETLLERVEVTTGPQPRHSVIWLHGLGADGHDFEPVVPELGLGGLAVRFIFPHAEPRPVTVNGGMRMRAWYDIRSLSASRDQDEAGIEASRRQVQALIEHEVNRGISPERIVLAGFSQGGAVAMHVALRFAQPLAGLVSLSGYLLFPERLAAERNAANQHLPVLMAHGTQDPVVPFAMGQAAAHSLQALGYGVTFNTYPVQHSVSLAEIRDIGSWLRARMA